MVRLKKWLYGIRKAASSWEEFYTEKFVEKGFQPGSVCLSRGSWRRLYVFWPPSGTSGTPKIDGVLV